MFKSVFSLFLWLGALICISSAASAHSFVEDEKTVNNPYLGHYITIQTGRTPPTIFALDLEFSPDKNKIQLVYQFSQGRMAAEFKSELKLISSGFVTSLEDFVSMPNEREFALSAFGRSRH